MKLLIIDNSNECRGELKNNFTYNGMIVNFHEATTFSEAFNLLDANRYECIVSEYMLDDGDAFGLIDKLSTFHFYTPLIVITDKGDESVAVRLIKSGAYDYLSKKELQKNENRTILIDSVLKSVSHYRSIAEKRRHQIALAMSEERYRGLIENSPLLVFRFFKDDNMVNFVNDGFCSYFGLERHEIIGEDMSAVFSGENKEDVLNRLKEPGEDKSVVAFELNIERNGKKLWQQWSIQEIKDRMGNVVEYQCIGEDITNIKEINEKLNQSLENIRDLKELQDGDYFLTSVVLEPLGRNHARSDRVQIEFFVKENKEFKYKNWKRSLGGDICFSHNIYLKDKIYIVFLNADAMGKSMQGASGALILGAVFQAIIDRSRFSDVDQQYYPEVWLKRSFMELHRIFENFDGSMLISLVMGLVEEDSGLVYYINAEHPWNVLYRNAEARFIESELTARKIGLVGFNDVVPILTFQLLKDDAIIVGSDGRDELTLKGADGNEYVNDDEKLFLAMVEKGEGNLEQIYRYLCEYGEIRDDLSLLKITFLSEDENYDQNRAYDALEKSKSLTGKEKIHEAILVLEESVKLFPKEPALLSELALLYFNEYEYDQAYKYADRCILIDPSNTEVIYYASFSAMYIGEMRIAEELAERVYLREPFETKYSVHYAKILATNEKYSDAYSLITSIFENDPECPAALSLLEDLNKKMGIMEWSNEYSVGIKEIDQQHVSIINMINDLKHSIFKIGGIDTINTILKKMDDYAYYHFETEEKYMIQGNYKDYNYHKKEHEYFKNELVRFQKLFHAGRANLTVYIISFLSTWLKNHIIKTDKKYSQCFKDLGLE